MSSTHEFPFRRDDPFRPPARYDTLRAEEPVCRVRLPTGATAWLLTRYADVRDLLGDPTVSSDIRHPAFPALGIGEREAGSRTRPFIRTDPPRHTRFRKLFVGEFTPRRVQAARPVVQKLVDGLVDEFAARPGPVDLVPDYANAVTTTVVCALLGVPADDVEFFREVTRVSGSRTSTSEEVSAALGELFALLGALVRAKAATPGDDLVGRLVAEHLPAGTVTEQELVSALAMTIIAGRETTTSMIALGTLYLIEHPELRAELAANPAAWPAAVGELLRVLSVGDSLALRVLTEPRTFTGVTIPAGNGVIGLLGAANHDPEVFPDPAQVRLDRGGPGHLSFGHGRHACFGATLAGVELEIALRTLVERVPELRVADVADPVEYKHESATFGVERMLVTVSG
ncbi:cytochrome P450 [Pseudonocardia sp. NPDC049635]|uniref:cytochrome P450 n=1 Tax=Pseudonocardia sp. NPDC049635 TaxID=3155506 RepID=UPI0034057A88